MAGVPQRVQYPGRLLAGLAAAALLALWGAVAYYASESAYQRENSDPYQVAAQFVRLRPVASALPANAVIGYWTDAQPDSVVESAMFLSAQYVLAPRLLQKGAIRDWVLGNFTRPADFAALGRSRGLRLQQDFGNGVVLFQRQQ